MPCSRRSRGAPTPCGSRSPASRPSTSRACWWMSTSAGCCGCRSAVAATSEVITVSASAVSIQTEEGSLGQVIKGNVAVELPLAGRRYTELALLVPGVDQQHHDRHDARPGLVPGQRQLPHAEQLRARRLRQQPGHAERPVAVGAGRAAVAGLDQRVQGPDQRFSAEFGRSAGAVVNVSIKSGTNVPHGSAWYYNRDASLAATSWRSNLIGAPKDTLEWHQTGGTFGGPIRRNKAFYFGAYEGFRRTFSETFLTTVPDAGDEERRVPGCGHRSATGQPFAEQHHSVRAASIRWASEDHRPVSVAEPAGAHRERPAGRKLRRAAPGDREHAQGRPPHRLQPVLDRPLCSRATASCSRTSTAIRSSRAWPTASATRASSSTAITASAWAGTGSFGPLRQRGARRLQQHARPLRARHGHRPDGHGIRLRRAADRAGDDRRAAADGLQQLQRPGHAQLPAAVPGSASLAVPRHREHGVRHPLAADGRRGAHQARRHRRHHAARSRLQLHRRPFHRRRDGRSADRLPVLAGRDHRAGRCSGTRRSLRRSCRTTGKCRRTSPSISGCATSTARRTTAPATIAT